MGDAAGTIVVLVAICLVFAVIALFTRMKLRTYESQKRCLMTATKALKKHYEAVDQILDDPAPSLALKQLMVCFTRGIGERHVAIMVSERLLTDAKSMGRKSADVQKLADELEALRRTRPDLTKSFDIAVTTGMIALMTRWPETQQMFGMLQTELTSDREKKISFIKRVTDCLKSDNDNRSNTGPSIGGSPNVPQAA